jgi:hypothetical protein
VSSCAPINRSALAVIAGMMVFTSSARADFVVNVGSSPTPASWGGVSAWSSSNPGDQTTNFYWTGDSWDSNQAASVGNFLTKTSYFSATASSPAIPKANLEFVKSPAANGLPSTPISFGSTGAVTEVVTKMLVEVAGFKGSNELWYNDTTGFHKIFNGSDGTGSGASFTAYGVFFLELRRGSFIQSTENSGGAANFSVFRDKTARDTVYLGIEDLKLSESDKDYNDMVISMHSLSPVPAPPTALLAGLGSLGSLGFYLLRAFACRSVVV